MKTHLVTASIIFLLVIVGSLLARAYNWYHLYWYADIILHTLSGVALGLVWLWLSKERGSSSLFVIILGTIGFAILGSVLWEFWEFAGWRITPSHVRFYIPELGDTLGDILCGAIGGLISTMSTLLRKK